MDCAMINIPTLNRATHLKRCLDSLANNGWAIDSPLQISVDYPPSPKYESGYRELLEMLQEYDFSRFKSVKIFYQKENLGPANNFAFLFDHSPEYMIFTEDDNEFSPNFLEYINKGLKLFEKDETVYSVNGMADTQWFHEKDANIVFSKLFPAYGVGLWRNKRNSIESCAKEFLLDKHNWTVRNFGSLWRKNSYLFSSYLIQIICDDKGMYWVDGSLNMADIPLSIYMHMSETKCVVPIVSKSRTFGNDGSGIHMPNLRDNGTKDLDNEETFVYHTPTTSTPDKRNYRLGEEYLSTSFPSTLAKIKMISKAFICLALLYMCGKRREPVIRFIGKFRKTV